MQLDPIDSVSGIYPAEDYIHALGVKHAERFLFISGTMGLDERGKAPAKLEDQLVLIWSNIGRILAQADMDSSNIVRITSYLRERSFDNANQAARMKALGGRRVPTTALVAETLETDWLVEIEAIAAA